MAIVQNAKQMMQMLNASQNPQKALEQFASMNPNARKIMEIANQKGGMKNMFYNYCRDMGINPNDILSMLK